MSIIKFIKDSTLASSIVFLGATVGTVGIVSGTALAKPKPIVPKAVVVLVNSPISVNVANVSNTTVQEGSTGDVFYNANSLFGNTSNKGNITSGSVTNTNTSTITVDQ